MATLCAAMQCGEGAATLDLTGHAFQSSGASRVLNSRGHNHSHNHDNSNNPG